MANRDMTPLQFSFEKHRKTLNCHFFITDGAGTAALDGQGSKGVLSVAKTTAFVQAGLYTIKFGYSAGTLNFSDTYIKSLVLDNVPEIEYAGVTNPAATATLALFRDDSSNNVPVFGDVAPVTSAVTDAGVGGTLAASAYKWVVAAVDSFGNETQLPTMIAQEVTFTPTVNHKVNVNWTALTLAGVIGYNIYRTAATGASGSENVFVGFAAGAATNTFVDLGTAGTAAYQGGAATLGQGGAKTPNYLLPAFNFAKPAFCYGGITVGFYNGTTPTNPAQGEGMRIQVEMGDSGAP